MAQRRSPAAQPQLLPFFGPVGAAGAAGAAGPVPPPAFVVAGPVGARPVPPLVVLEPADATAALADVAGAALTTGATVSGGATTGGAEGAACTVFSVAMGWGLSPPFITKNAPTIASADTAIPTPMKIGALLAGGGARLGAAIIGAAIGAAT